MKIVTIPTCASPFVVIINDIKYIYPAGETMEVPDEVAVVIEQHYSAHSLLEDAADAPSDDTGGGSLGEIIAYNYGATLPDINEFWNGRVKEKLPYAFIVQENGMGISLWLYDTQFSWGPNLHIGLKATSDIVGYIITYNQQTNRWDDEEVDMLHTYLDVLEFVAYEGDVLFAEDHYSLIWMSENQESQGGDFKTIFFDPAPVYSQSGGGSSGDNGGSVVNPDKSGVIKFDINARVGHAGEWESMETFFKLNDEPFRINPDLPITLNRIVGMTWEANPWHYNYEQIKQEHDGKLPEFDYNLDVKEGYEVMWVEDPPASGEWCEYFYRVTAESVEAKGVTLSKGLYVKAMGFTIPISFEIAPPTE